jgi:hypothetical protein
MRELTAGEKEAFIRGCETGYETALKAALREGVPAEVLQQMEDAAEALLRAIRLTLDD